jgi:translation initiation factor IF-1
LGKGQRVKGEEEFPQLSRITLYPLPFTLSTTREESFLAKDDLIPAAGIIVDKQPNAFFKVQLDNSDHIVLAAISGKMRKNRIRILVGDRVSVEMSPYYRFK